MPSKPTEQPTPKSVTSAPLRVEVPNAEPNKPDTCPNGRAQSQNDAGSNPLQADSPQAKPSNSQAKKVRGSIRLANTPKEDPAWERLSDDDDARQLFDDDPVLLELAKQLGDDAQHLSNLYPAGGHRPSLNDQVTLEDRDQVASSPGAPIVAPLAEALTDDLSHSVEGSEATDKPQPAASSMPFAASNQQRPCSAILDQEVLVNPFGKADANKQMAVEPAASASSSDSNERLWRRIAVASLALSTLVIATVATSIWSGWSPSVDSNTVAELNEAPNDRASNHSASSRLASQSASTDSDFSSSQERRSPITEPVTTADREFIYSTEPVGTGREPSIWANVSGTYREAGVIAAVETSGATIRGVSSAAFAAGTISEEVFVAADLSVEADAISKSVAISGLFGSGVSLTDYRGYELAVDEVIEPSIVPIQFDSYGVGYVAIDEGIVSLPEVVEFSATQQTLSTPVAYPNHYGVQSGILGVSPQYPVPMANRFVFFANQAEMEGLLDLYKPAQGQKIQIEF